MPAFTRRQYAGAAASTTITAGINTTDTTCTLAATTGWPSTAGVSFYVVIDPGTSAEEKCSATISGSTLTLTRAQDDTTASSHSAGATIYPVFTANDADEANELVAKLTTKGDLLVTTGSALNRLAVGTNDYSLLADSSATNGVAWKQIPAAGLASDAVTTAKILDANVTTAKIADLNVTGAKLANLTVSTKTTSYTLVAADRNTRVVMNSASSTTITVNTSLFSAGDVVYIHNIGSGTCTVTAGTATVTTSGSLALAQWGGGTLYFTSASASIFFPYGGIGYGTATGGTSSSITVGGQAYTMLAFTSTATLTVSKAGLFDIMLVAGGGAGNGGGQSSGGGGAGIITSTIYLAATTYTATVAAGGAAAAVGSPSYLGVTTVGSQVAPVAVGGGSYTQRGANGYGQIADFATTVSALFTGQGGFSGGAGQGTNTNGGGGGGGGSANGGNGTASVGGAGGAGFDASAWRGEAALTTRYAGGGGGGIAGTGTGGAGGAGGGGAGVQGATAPNAGTANTGGGGGGAGSGATGGNGGSGIILVRFKV